MILKKGQVYWLEDPDGNVRPAKLLICSVNQMNLGFEFNPEIREIFFGRGQVKITTYLAMDHKHPGIVTEVLTGRDWKLHEHKPTT